MVKLKLKNLITFYYSNLSMQSDSHTKHKAQRTPLPTKVTTASPKVFKIYTKYLVGSK
jgi:hypothetical protein